MGEVLFVSQNPLGRCENLMAVWNAYDGDKAFRHGIDGMRTAEKDGFDVVVCDCLPAFIEGKERIVSINICHAITGNKVYGLHEHGQTYDSEAFLQTDVATAASEPIVPIVAGQLGIPENRVVVTGLPRTDALFGKSKGDGGTEAASFERSYLYLPTFRWHGLGGWLPGIDWAKLDSELRDGEMLFVKRHYFTEKPLMDGNFKHIRELSPWDAANPWLIDCDVLLTDYSSCVADAYLMGKPVVLAVDDMEEYLADRPMYFEYPQFYCSRWVKAEGNEYMLVKSLREAYILGMGGIERNYRDVVAGACDGHSTERVCDLIRSVL